MEAVLVTLIAGLLAALVTWMLVRAALKLLIAYNVVDRPGKRSNHKGNVPTGGGIAVIGVVLTSWMCLALLTGTLGETRIIVGAAAVLAGISFIDDIRYVPQLARLTAHVAAVALGLTLLPDAALLFDGLLPYWADRLATCVAWVWFINLFNFMDGIDGITRRRNHRGGGRSGNGAVAHGPGREQRLVEGIAGCRAGGSGSGFSRA